MAEQRAKHTVKTVKQVATHILRHIDHLHSKGVEYKDISTAQVFDLVGEDLDLNRNQVLHLTYARVPQVLDEHELDTFNEVWTRIGKGRVHQLGGPPANRRQRTSHLDVKQNAEAGGKNAEDPVMSGQNPVTAEDWPWPGVQSVEKLVEINGQLERDIRAAMDLCEEVGKRNRELEDENNQLMGKLLAAQAHIEALQQDEQVKERVRLYDMTDTKHPIESGLQDAEIVDALVANGFKFKRRNGKHPIFVHPTKGMLVIPNTIIGAFRKDIMARITGHKER